MRLTLVEHSTRQFSYTNADKTLVAEASDLENRHLERIYDDACDVGFAVKSHLTGHVVTIVMTTPIYRGEGEDREVSGWHYTPADFSVRAFPECAGLKALIFND